jgi:hypothetical protein
VISDAVATNIDGRFVQLNCDASSMLAFMPSKESMTIESNTNG